MSKGIIGNNKGRRKPVDLTGKILADAQSYKPQKDLETKTNESPIIQPSGNLSFVTDKNMYKEFSKYLEKEHPNVENHLIFEDNVMKYSSTYLATAMDMFLKKVGSKYRLATQLNLEDGLDFLGETYVDSGLALRNLVNTNREFAIDLFEQLEQKGVTSKSFPFFFDLKGLELNKGLGFNLTDESFYAKADCLNWEYGTKFSKINMFGLPLEEDNSSHREVWTSDYALSGVSLRRARIIDSENHNLDHSSAGGRIVLAKENKK